MHHRCLKWHVRVGSVASSIRKRSPGMRPGTRVLLVDQWVETGGAMGAGIELIKRQGGVVSGIAAVCIEDTLAGK